MIRLFSLKVWPELPETYKHLAGISEEKEKQCLQNGGKIAIFNIFQ